jgi:hypothetical protein
MIGQGIFGDGFRASDALRLTMLLMLVVPAVTSAQAREADRLAAAKSASCVFSTMAVGTWNGGAATAEVKPAKLTVGFDQINTEEGTARVVGAFGPSDIIVKLSAGTLHFVQAFREGPLYTTTIFSQESRGGKLKAVHTRHEYTEVSLPGFTSRPEQYYGECEIVK